MRHPMYASLMALTWWRSLKDPLTIGSILLAQVRGLSHRPPHCARKENLACFGARLRSHMNGRAALSLSCSSVNPRPALRN